MQEIKFNRYQRATIGEFMYRFRNDDMNAECQIKLIRLLESKRLISTNDATHAIWDIDAAKPEIEKKVMQILIDKVSESERKKIAKEFESKI